MKLTGKALEDFQVWYISHIRQREDIGDRYFDHTLLDFFWRSGNTMIGAFVIEWFDSVGIYIFTDMTNVSDRFIFHVNNEFNEVEYNSRQQATEDAILKANEIYNQNQE